MEVITYVVSSSQSSTNCCVVICDCKTKSVL